MKLNITEIKFIPQRIFNKNYYNEIIEMNNEIINLIN